MILALTGGLAHAAELLDPAGRSDRSIGNPSAPVTIIEYSSPTCPSCVTYRTEVAPLIETEFVETGKVRIVFRPLARNAVDLAIFMLAEKKTGDDYQRLVDLFYSKHTDITTASDIEATLRAIAGSAGIGDADFNRQLSDGAAHQALERLKTQAIDDFDVQGTPTFFINGRQVTGALSADEMRAQIADALNR
jgi:protein-disulfide isomerase